MDWTMEWDMDLEKIYSISDAAWISRDELYIKEWWTYIEPWISICYKWIELYSEYSSGEASIISETKLNEELNNIRPLI